MRLFLSFGLLWLLFSLFTPAWAGQANMFVYHRFGDARYPATNIAVEVFAKQLELLRTKEYTVLPLGDVVDRLAQGEPLPERCAVLTVDDAYESFLTGAMPLLRRYGYPVSLFVSTDSVGGAGYLNWAQLRALRDEGVEIGNHSASHPYLLDRQKGEDAVAWLARIRADIERASAALQRELGGMSRVFAYPYGEYSPEVAKLVGTLGFLGAVAQHSGVVEAESDLFALPRFPMGGAYATFVEFRDKLALRPLKLKVLSSASPVIEGKNPPELLVEISDSEVDLKGLRCFVGGQQGGILEPVPGHPGRYRVAATAPLEGRRSRYTLTAPGRNGGWHWYSRLWIQPQP
jgi:peptidoglycan/xylan/chitin deacetylase (PgdA/CDA1 family)